MQSSNIETKGMLTQNLTEIDFFAPVRGWIDNIEIKNRRTAHMISRLIPSQCPFERDIVVFGHVIAHIPPLCKLNPLYEQFIGLRFRSLCYLADVCGEDIQVYC